MAYFPVAHLEPVGTDSTPDPDHDGDDDRAGAPPSVAAWESLMRRVIRADMNTGLMAIGDEVALTAEHFPVPEGDLGTVDMMDAGDCYCVDLGGDIIYVPTSDAEAASLNDNDEDDQPQSPRGQLPYNMPS